MNIKAIVRDRIVYLLQLAKENAKTHPERSQRYVQLALKLSTRHKVRIPKKFKMSFCKICYSYWIPGYNVKVKIDKKNKIITYTCCCGNRHRFKYKRNDKQKVANEKDR